MGSFLYEVPVGRGRKFGTQMGRALDAIVGGWQVGGILTLQTGFPYTISVSMDRANIGRSGGQRPDARGRSFELSDPRPELWFDTRAFALPAVGTFGNLGRNTMRADGTQTVDFSLQKKFRIKERMRFEFRAEAFNLFNHANFGAPNAVMNADVPLDATPGDPRMTPNRFGVVTSAADARILQFGLRFVW